MNKDQIPTGENLNDLVQLAIKFKEQQRGKRPGFLNRYITGIVADMKKPTFKNLLSELEIEAARRDLRGEKASPVEKIDRVWEMMTYHDPKKGRIQKPFGTIRNYLTKAKKKFTHKPEP